MDSHRLNAGHPTNGVSLRLHAARFRSGNAHSPGIRRMHRELDRLGAVADQRQIHFHGATGCGPGAVRCTAWRQDSVRCERDMLSWRLRVPAAARPLPAHAVLQGRQISGADLRNARNKIASARQTSWEHTRLMCYFRLLTGNVIFELLPLLILALERVTSRLESNTA